MLKLTQRLDRGVLAAGTEVGSYVIVKELADGGMGTIYEADHKVLPRRAAIKVLHLHLVDTYGAAERMALEAQVLEKVQQQGVVRVHDAGKLEDGRPWLAMELLEGETLGQRLNREQRLAPADAIEVIRQIVEILAVAHARGVVHRDLKPDNLVMQRAADGTLQAKLIDWGVAWVAARTRKLTEIGLTPGTPDYMSPEQARGAQLDGQSDIYSLGVIAFELLTGEMPFTGANAVEIVVKHLTVAPPALAPLCPDIPRLLEHTVLRMMSKDPSLRPSIDELRFALEVIAFRLRTEARREAPVDDDEPEIEISMEVECDERADELDQLIDELEVDWELAVA